jgi:ribonucleoside-diphosphate reductase beta chain
MNKLLIRQSNDVNNLMPIKYEWIMKMYHDMNSNTWFPQEIPMGKDKSDFESLTENEKHIFVTTLSFLTTADVLALRNISYALAEKITAPEAQIFLSSQAYQESNHMISYSHAIETIGLDQEETYTKYITVPEIAAKSKLLTDYTKDICNLPNDLTLDGDVEKLLEGIFFFSGIFEGSSFMTNFNPIFAIKRNTNKMRGTVKQLDYIRRDETIHTGFGLKLIKEIIKETGIGMNLERIQAMFDKSLAVEIDYAKYLLKTPLMGYTIDDHIEQFKWYCNQRANFVGVPRPFETGTYLPWVNEMMDTNKEANFFEERVTEYQPSSNLTWSKPTSMNDVLNWKENVKYEPIIDIKPGAICNMEEGCEVCQ